MLLREIVGKVPPRRTLSVDDEIRVTDVDTVDPACAVGIELEVENCYEFPTVPQHAWGTHTDNSLREHGVEFVSVPLYGIQVYGALELLCNRMLPPHVKFSQRTSVHVHIDVGGLTGEQLAQVVLVYLVFERSLYRYVGGGRDHNIFCIPLMDTASARNLVTAMKDPDQLINSDLASEESRYAGLNLAAIRKFGTLEFRHMYGTKNPDSIHEWINILLSIRRFALRHDSLKVLLERVLALNTNSEYNMFALDVFGTGLNGALSGFELAEEMYEGVAIVKYGICNGVYHRQVIASPSWESPAGQWLSENNWQRQGSSILRSRGFPPPVQAPDMILRRDA